MIIGILTHHFAANFGANLQTLSTVEYIRNSGHTPLVINWRNKTMEDDFRQKISSIQLEEHNHFFHDYLPSTKECHTDAELAQIVYEEKIDAIIIGSDAVVQHHPFITRIAFPTRHFISIRQYTSDRLYPNFFWGSFTEKLRSTIPMAYMSVSCQNSPYKLFTNRTLNQMRESCSKFCYISVRDTWTKKMFCRINRLYTDIAVTPDPVFGFNQNADKFISSENEIRDKFSLSGKYILLSFFGNNDVSMEWIKALVDEIRNIEHEPVILPFPSGSCHIPNVKTIHLPLSPIDWYALIKYSSGYIGRNMHPIVVSLHNAVPFFCLDQYGTRRFNLFVNQKSSKIYHILETADFLENRITYAGINKKLPSPKTVIDRILGFDKKKCSEFSLQQTERYNTMMNNIISRFIEG